MEKYLELSVRAYLIATNLPSMPRCPNPGQHRRADPLLYCIILSAEEILGQGAGKIPQTP